MSSKEYINFITLKEEISVNFEKSTSLRKYLYGSPITTNATLEKDGKTYIIDENGVATEKMN